MDETTTERADRPVPRWGELGAATLRELAERDALVLVPVGSMEQHGPHLPVQVDAMLATAVCERATTCLPDSTAAVVAPTVWCGLAEHHMALGGTITLDFDTFRALLRCVCTSLVRHGFRRIVLVNGHGGNITALNVITGELARELQAPITTATYWLLTRAAERFAEILEVQQNVRHACEAETSMMLALSPQLVDRQAMATVDGSDAGIIEPSGVYRYRSFAALSASGVLGAPASATSSKGEALLDAAAQALADAVLGEQLWHETTD